MTIYENGQPLLYEKRQTINTKSHKNDQQMLDNHQDLPLTTGDNDSPYESSQALSESSQAWSKSNQAPSKSSQTPSKSSQTPSKSSQTPSKSSQTPSRSSQAWSENSQVPSESNQALSESSKVPSQAPSGSSQVPGSSSQAPSESDQLLDKSVHQNHQRALTGFALCLSYWEQQTNALLNMWSFQKWANQSGNLSVVEPFTSNSVLGFPSRVLYNFDFENALHFRDYFDFEYWTNETAKRGIPPMVTWDTFIRHASRKVVVVILVYEVPPGGVYINDDLKKHRGCNNELKGFNSSTQSLMNHFHFEVIKIVCFASYAINEGRLYPTLEKFNSYIIDSDYDAVTYWFSFWRGVEFDRITIKNQIIQRGEENALAMARPSPKIIEDSKRYVKTVLKVDTNEYTAVAFRTQGRKNAMMFNGYSRDAILAYFLKCASNISIALKGLETNRSLLSIDLGRFGDLTSGNYYDYDSSNTFDGKGTKVFQTALNAVYGNKTVDEYHNDFIRAANGIEDSGYIGAMQKTIAENAKCLVVMGGHSSFQRSIILHHKDKSDCVKYICYEEQL